MYESMTYETILGRMLDKIPNTVDKREGAVIYDALAPAAAELALIYLELDDLMNESFADTASREFLIRRAKERGITPYPATPAKLKGVFAPSSIEILGQRFNLNRLNYVAKEKIADGEYVLECETSGSEGNKYLGKLVPIDYIEGLQTANLTELLVPGEDEESTESIRSRYFSSFGTQAFGGNRKDYIEKSNAIPGVGATKVTSAWNGGGTVKLTILNSDFDTASSALVSTVKQYFDPPESGEGWGLAPIGHIVTVVSADAVPIHIGLNITYEDGYRWENTKQQITDAIGAYLLELRQSWQSQSELIVRVTQVETRVLSVPGVLDVYGTTLNGKEENVALSDYQIPTLGSVNANG